MSETQASSVRSRVIGALRIAFALGLLWFVAQTVPWRDSLVVDGQSFTGQVRGDWKGEEIHFRLDALEEVPQALRESGLGAALATGDEVLARHDGITAGSFHAAECTWQAGMPRAFSDLDLRGVFTALGFMLVSSIVCITRWWRLLALIDCRTSWGNAMRLTYIGLFFNLVVPGLTGGDLIRGVMVVREHPDRRADALMSVIVDRLLGLLMLTAIAVAAIFWVGEPLHELRLPVALALGAILAGLAAFLNPNVRRLTHFDAIVDRLPKGEKLRKLDRALRHYASQPAEMAFALLLSLVNHLMIAAAIMTIGHAFGDQLAYPQYLSVSGVANTLSSLPIAPGGWGVGEAAFGTLFVMLGAAATLGVATSVTFRLCNMALSLVGGVFLILPGGRKMRAEIEQTRSIDADD
ncbi:MAG: hypothetical protein ACI8QZ_004075 [Chlamydiales bacterium]